LKIGTIGKGKWHHIVEYRKSYSGEYYYWYPICHSSGRSIEKAIEYHPNHERYLCPSCVRQAYQDGIIRISIAE
jgi:hypothetical protein